MTVIDHTAPPAAVPGPWVTKRARPARVGVHVNAATDLDVECLDVSRFEHAQIWLPILGPTSTVALATLVAAGDSWWNTVELAERVGVRVPKLWDAIDRLCRFDAAALVSTDVVVVRGHLPFPEARRLERFTPATRSFMEGIATCPR